MVRSDVQYLEVALRITYGVHGYGRGHAARAMAVLPDLVRRHDVQILAGGDAYDLLSPEFPVQRIPTLGYTYGRRDRPSTWRTIASNGPTVIDILIGGSGFAGVQALVKDFQPDVIISDAEAFTHRAGRRLKIPRIGFDHYGVLVYCRAPCHWYDRPGLMANAMGYRILFGRPDRAIVSSFYSCPPRGAGVRCVAPLLRPEVLQTRASRKDHLLVYLIQPRRQFSDAIKHVLRSYPGPVHVYGLPHLPAEGNLVFLPHSNLPFVEDLASCRAVVSTAGNQLVGEAIHFRKPMLVMPEATVEQRINALALQRMRLGVSVSLGRFSRQVLDDFLARCDEFRANMDRAAEQEWVDARCVLQQTLQELTAVVSQSGVRP